MWVSAEGLDFSSNARTVRVKATGHRSVVNGPAIDSKEQLGGYWIIEVDDIDDAVMWARAGPDDDGSRSRAWEDGPYSGQSPL